MNVTRKTIRSILLSTVVAGGFAFAGVASSVAASPAMLQPDSNWAISKIAAGQLGGDSYCALARRFDNGLILTMARNSRDEGSIAIDFQKDVLNSAVEYPVTVSPNTGGSRSFSVHPVSGKAVVIRLGRDYAFYDALTRSSVLGINVAGTQYNFAVSDFPQGQEKLNGCLATMTEPAAGPVAEIRPVPQIPQPVPVAPMAVPVAPVAAEPAPILSFAPQPAPVAVQPVPQQVVQPLAQLQPIAQLTSADIDSIIRDKTASLTGKIDALRAENDKLRQIADSQRYDFEARLQSQSSASAEVAVIQNQVRALQDENSALRQQVEVAIANAAPAAPPVQLTQQTCPAPDKTAENILNAELERLRQENLRLNQDIVLTKARVTSLESVPAASEAKLVEAGQRAIKAETELASVKLQLATSEKIISENERRLADANLRVSSLTQELAQKALMQAQAPIAAPVLTPPPVIDNQEISRLQGIVTSLQSENASLKSSLERAQAAAVSAVSTSAGSSADGAYEAARELALMKEELELTRKERDRLKKDIDNSQLGKEDRLLSIASANWDLEQATRRYNEAEREIRRLGSQIETERNSCTKEKKSIEGMLFDPRIADRQQVSKIDELQKSVDMANLALDLEKKRSKELSEKLAALGSAPPPSLAAMAASLAPAAGDAGSREIGDVTVSSAGVPVMPAVPATPVAQVELPRPAPVVAPAPVVEAPRANPISEIASATLAEKPAAVLPKLNIPAPVPAAPEVAQMSVDDVSKLLSSIGVKDASDVRKSDGSSGRFIAYSWKAGNMFGTAEQTRTGASDDFDGLAQAYLEKAQGKCKGDFAVMPGSDNSSGSVQASTYQLACVSSGGETISASVIFFTKDGFFTTVAHETSVEGIDTAIDATDSLFNRLTGTKVASR